MDLQRIFNSSFGVVSGLALGKSIPTRFGYTLSSWVAEILSRRRSSPMVSAIRSNQRIIRGESLSQSDLTKATRDVFTHTGRCFIDLYKNIQNPERLKSKVQDNYGTQQLIEQSKDPSYGAIVVAPHMSNFDLCLLGLAYRGLKAQVLSYGTPTGGYKIQNKIRAHSGLKITPVCTDTHIHAVEFLKYGGFVITAIDRPIIRKTHYLNFFGHPSPLPAGHIRMALEAKVPIIVVSAFLDEQGLYQIHISDPIPMVPNREYDSAIRYNGETVLRVVEERIQNNPGQWLMYYPVWPEVNLSN